MVITTLSRRSSRPATALSSTDRGWPWPRASRRRGWSGRSRAVQEGGHGISRSPAGPNTSRMVPMGGCLPSKLVAAWRDPRPAPLRLVSTWMGPGGRSLVNRSHSPRLCRTSTPVTLLARSHHGGNPGGAPPLSSLPRPPAGPAPGRRATRPPTPPGAEYEPVVTRPRRPPVPESRSPGWWPDRFGRPPACLSCFISSFPFFRLSRPPADAQSAAALTRRLLLLCHNFVSSGIERYKNRPPERRRAVFN